MNNRLPVGSNSNNIYNEPAINLDIQQLDHQMKTTLRLLTTSTILATMTLCSAAYAQDSIGIQFPGFQQPLPSTDTAGVVDVSQPNWNVITYNQSAPGAAPTTELVNNLGTDSGAQFSEHCLELMEPPKAFRTQATRFWPMVRSIPTVRTPMPPRPLRFHRSRTRFTMCTSTPTVTPLVTWKTSISQPERRRLFSS